MSLYIRIAIYNKAGFAQLNLPLKLYGHAQLIQSDPE